MKVKAVYVQQYDYFWKLTPEQWRALLVKALEEGGHELPITAQMLRRPSKVHVEWMGEDKSYYVSSSDVLYYEPLDWDLEEYQDALNDLDELENSND